MRSISLVILAILGPHSAVSAADTTKISLHRAVGFLVERQNPDGGYGPYEQQGRVENASDVGITAIVLTALAKHPRQYKAVDGPFISETVKFLLSKQQPDGGFYDPRDPVLKNYRTCVAIMALSTLDRALYAEPIARARVFVEGLQLAEGKGYRQEEHLSFGGVSYGGSSFRADISNSGMAAGAFKAAGLSASHPLWKKLQVFTSRCQNMPKTDALLGRAGVGTSGDGGFRYSPNDTRGPVDSIDGLRVFRSYGSMTYQGLKTLLYSGVRRDDPRVLAAFDWISKNFDVRENPGMASKYNPKAGQQGLYYYYHTMARALSAYGELTFEDSRGKKHNWALELSQHLAHIQHKDGYWVNESDRWWENIKELDTAFSMIALTICQEELNRPNAKKISSEKPAPGGSKD